MHGRTDGRTDEGDSISSSANAVGNQWSLNIARVFPPPCYASAVLAVAMCLSFGLSVCLSVCLSQAGIILKWLHGSS